jgi:hypothetical protein
LGAPWSRSSRGRGFRLAFFQWIHHVHQPLGGSSKVHQLLGGSPKVFQLLLTPLILLAQRLDLLKAVDELSLGVADPLLQPLDVICTGIQQVLHVSKQLFFIR